MRGLRRGIGGPWLAILMHAAALDARGQIASGALTGIVRDPPALPCPARPSW